MTTILRPEAISNTPFDIYWVDKTDSGPKSFIMDYFGRSMPHSHWVVNRLMYDFVDDPYINASTTMMYDVGNVLPDGTYVRSALHIGCTAIRVLSFGNKEEDTVRAQAIHDKMLQEDSWQLAVEGRLGSPGKDASGLLLL